MSKESGSVSGKESLSGKVKTLALSHKLGLYPEYTISDVINNALAQLGNIYVIDIKYQVTGENFSTTEYALIIYKEVQ